MRLSLIAGAGVSRFRDFEYRFNPDIFIPAGAQVLVGRRRHFGVMGGGAILRNVVYASHKVKQLTHRRTDIMAYIKLGYKYVWIPRKLFCQVYYVPLFIKDRGLAHSAGIGLGFIF